MQSPEQISAEIERLRLADTARRPETASEVQSSSVERVERVEMLVLWRRAGSFFTVERYRPRLEALHDRDVADGPFVAYSTRFLIEARKRR